MLDKIIWWYQVLEGWWLIKVLGHNPIWNDAGACPRKYCKVCGGKNYFKLIGAVEFSEDMQVPLVVPESIMLRIYTEGHITKRQWACRGRGALLTKFGLLASSRFISATDFKENK